MLAAIDLGSNSFRLHIGGYADGRMVIVRTARESNRLAAGLGPDGWLHDDAMQKGFDALEKLRDILVQYPLTRVRAVATSTLRIAVNAPDFLRKAGNILGHPVEVISGEEEGRLIYLGVARQLSRPDERRLVVDIGGGSTEVVLGRGMDVDFARSFEIGTVGQSLAFFPEAGTAAEGFGGAVLAARKHFDGISLHGHGWQVAYGSSGSIRAIAEIIAGNAIGDGELTYQNLQLLAGKIPDAGIFQGLPKKRFATLVGGMSILAALMSDGRIPVMTPIDSGLRMGVLWSLVA